MMINIYYLIYTIKPVTCAIWDSGRRHCFCMYAAILVMPILVMPNVRGSFFLIGRCRRLEV